MNFFKCLGCEALYQKLTGQCLKCEGTDFTSINSDELAKENAASRIIHPTDEQISKAIEDANKFYAAYAKSDWATTNDALVSISKSLKKIAKCLESKKEDE